VEFDLIDRLGWFLRDVGVTFTWHDLWVFTRHLPYESALARSLFGADYEWRLKEQILAGISDSLRVLVWQQTADGHKGKNQPKPMPRPGIEPDEDQTTYGKDAVSIEEMNAFLGWESQMAAPEDTA
jgi:hypothetical protein